jgi:outer membrane receptor protein involved in Fe transport
VSPRFEDIVSLEVRGGNRDWRQDVRRSEVTSSLTYFRDGWLGSHQLKVGADTMRNLATEAWEKSYPGGALHVLRDGLATEVYLFQAPSESLSGLWISSVFASDVWRVNDRLTLNLGLRFDRYRVFLPEQEHRPTGQTFPAVDNLIDWNTMAPRLGATYALSRGGRTLVKASYAKYWDAPGTQLGFNANPNSRVWWTRHDWIDADGSGDWQPGEEVLPALGSRGGTALEDVDPGLELSIVREVGAWFERELPAGIGLQTGFVWRGDRQPFMRVNRNQPFEAFTVPRPLADPGPDGIVNTADDGPVIQAYDLTARVEQDSIVRNVPNANGHNWTWDVMATRRVRDRWSLAAGFSHTWNRTQASAYFDQAVRNNPYPVTPNDLINTGKHGRHEFTTWTLKVYGSYTAPWALRITPLLRHQSGQPFGRTFSARLPNYGSVRILAEPIGTRRMDHLTLLDVRIERTFRLSASRRLGAFVDVFNLLNANPEQRLSWSSGSFLRPLSIVAPRIARIGMKVSW